MTTESDPTMPPDPANTPAASLRVRLVEIVLILLVFFTYTAEVPPDTNEAHYLSKAKHYWNPTWGAGDMFLESADAHVVFYWTIGWMTRAISLEATAWVGRLITWLALAWAWRRLSWAVVPIPLFAVLSAALFVTLDWKADFAGEWIVGGVEAKGFAYVGVLVALERALRSHYNAAWIALGVASAFHILVGGWSVLALFVGWVCTRRGEKLTAMLPGLLAGGCIALIGLLPAVQLSRGHAEDAVAAANRVYVFERLPHHLALLTQDAEKLRDQAIAHASAIGAFFLLGITAYTIRRRSGKSDDALAVARIMSFTVAALCATTSGLVIEVALAEEPTKAAAILRYYWYRLGDFAVPMAVSLLAVAVVHAVLEKKRALGTILLTAAMALPVWHLYETIEVRQQKPGPPTERPKKIRDREDWLATMQWINEFTPPKGLFLTPRGNRTFKWHTGRREVVNYKDVPQDATSIVTWYRRMDDVYGYTNRQGERKKKRSLGHLGTERVLELAQKYEVDFILTDTRRMLQLPIVYLNDTYVIYRAPSAKPPSSF